MDTLDLFGDEGAPSYRASLWKYRVARGVTSLGGTFSTIGEAEEALKGYTSSELPFDRELIPDGVSTYVAHLYGARLDAAVVLKDSTGDVVSRALLPKG